MKCVKCQSESEHYWCKDCILKEYEKHSDKWKIDCKNCGKKDTERFPTCNGFVCYECVIERKVDMYYCVECQSIKLEVEEDDEWYNFDDKKYQKEEI